MKIDNVITMILVIAAVVMAALIMVGLFFVTIPKENQQMVNIFAGAIITGALLTVYNYRFGSSKGSSDKTTLLKNETDDKNIKVENESK
jgi:uncharacterized BrkB/YihY/UPF0761 family membrane protein